MMFESDKKKICELIRKNKQLRVIHNWDIIHFYDEIGYVFQDKQGYFITQSGELGYIDENYDAVITGANSRRYKYKPKTYRFVGDGGDIEDCRKV